MGHGLSIIMLMTQEDRQCDPFMYRLYLLKSQQIKLSTLQYTWIYTSFQFYILPEIPM